MAIASFHPAVARWFRAAFREPTAAQAAAWPEIRNGRHTLIAAPTGSGKTLAAFLGAIDALVRDGVSGKLTDETRVLYVSPLKALSNDIERNLRWPLAGIRAQLSELGEKEFDIRVAVRTGDTPPGERAAMKKQPPHILVTTPESLYLLLTSTSGRAMLATVRSVIVDEIHAVAGSKRGSHLALSLERLAALVAPQALTRIGLSATQKPIDVIARFLVGSNALDANGAPACAIVDSGHVRERDLRLELPGAPLEAVMSGEVWEEIYNRMAELAHAHRTTLVFANTRRMVERVTRHLSERLGKDNVAAHHGSLSKEQRFDAEQRLKDGKLRVLVATASLELGIDIGDVDLVCQLSSPRSIATLLQRVGRANHSVGGIPKGRLFPLSRDELVECTALLDAVRRGELDRLIIPPLPLDVLAQQLVAEVASRDYGEDELFELATRAFPYHELARADFDAVLHMLSEGYATRRGRRSAYLHRDAVNRQVRARKGARLTALTCGGAIPDNADFRVLLAPTDTFVGTLNEDFAIESQTGDIFQLGNASYRILKIESGVVRVEDAKGAPPSIPFWLGEAPGRTDELSVAVARLRAAVNDRLPEIIPDTLAACVEWLMRDWHLDHAAAQQLTDYLAGAKGMLGTLPTRDTLVLERFFDETGGQQLIVHSPFGSRVNRAWGLALRKRFCRKFNFELQAAVTEDAIILSLGETHSFALEEVAKYLNSRSVRAVLVQALLTAPLFNTRWRWVANISLAVKRYRGGRKNPPQFQRIEAEDLVAVVFPDQIACAENIVGEREVPDHPLVNQTIRDCLTEAMDIEQLEQILAALENGQKQIVARDLPHPSPLAQEILNARPYGFLDDAPLEERRTQAVASRRWLDPAEAAAFGQLDTDVIARVRDEAWPTIDSADELHDALMLMGAVPVMESARGLFDALVRDRRATQLSISVPSPLQGEGQDEGVVNSLWVAVERLPMLRAIYPQASIEPALEAPSEFAARAWTREEALVELVRGQLQALGPVTVETLAARLGLTTNDLDLALATLEGEGFAMRGQFTPGLNEQEWCERRLLARVHRYTLERLRAEIEPLPVASFLRFLFRWHGITAEPKPEGPQALAAIIEQLEGFEAAAGSWEADLLPVRTQHYSPEWLDSLCLSGKVLWTRLTPPKVVAGKDKTGAPVRATPIALLTRRAQTLWREIGVRDEFSGTSKLASSTGRKFVSDPNFTRRLSPRAQGAHDYLATHGASFFDDIVHGTGLLKSQAEEALAELVAAGLVNADSFAGLRALLLPAEKQRKLRRRRTVGFTIEEAGRWALLKSATLPSPSFPLPQAGEGGEPMPAARALLNIEAVARILLKRYGVVCKRLLERETDALPSWFELLQVYRRLEARGEIRGGRFVAGLAGEQYALPEAVASLRALRKQPANGELVSLSAADPLNLVGILTPGARVPALAGNRVLYRDGMPIAVQIGGEAQFLETLTPGDEWAARNALLRSPRAPQTAAIH